MPMTAEVGRASTSRSRPAAVGVDTMEFRDAAERRQWFERRLEPLMDRLHGAALRLTRDVDDAEDVVAEAVVLAWRRLDGLRDPERFEAWLFHILSNAFISEWRHRRCRPAADQPIDPGPETDDAFSLYQRLHQPFLLWWGSTEERFFNGLLEEDLRQALDALPAPFRLVMVMVEVQGHTYTEAAGLLGIPVGTVRSRLNRARAILQRRLWEQARDAGLANGEPP